MCDTCGDNRFELIEKYKQKLLDATNIGGSPEEMAVIDNILFRFWQMGWLKGDMSSADAVPVVHGRWITHEYRIDGYAHASCECTACRASRPITLFPLNYCPNCGARMDGKDGDWYEMGRTLK